MIVCEYNTASVGGVQLVEKPTPTEAVPSRSGLFGTSLFASAGRLLVRVRACGVNPVDAKYSEVSIKRTVHLAVQGLKNLNCTVHLIGSF